MWREAMGSTKLLIFAVAVTCLFAMPVLGVEDGLESDQSTGETAVASVDTPAELPAESSEGEADATPPDEDSEAAAPIAVDETLDPEDLSAGAAVESEALAADADLSEPAEVAVAESAAAEEPTETEVAVTEPAEVDPADDVTGEIEALSSDLVSDPAALEAIEAEQSAEVAGLEEVAEVGDIAEAGEITEVEPAEEPVSVKIAQLGAIGYDSQGRRGRIHVVKSGDTLWDISDAYLGTPWVWPSIWNDNDNIVNPHQIEPDDRIWITPNEMRRISVAEAAAMLANLPPEEALDDSLGLASMDPDAGEIFPAPESAPEAVEVPEERPMHRVSNRENSGLISKEQLKSAATIVDQIPQRVLLTQQDRVYIGLGESETEVGDQYLAFRTNKKVFDPDNGRLLGYHIEVLGWVEVEETFPETSLARIRMSSEGIEKGDHLIPRKDLPTEIALQESPTDVEGKISFFPDNRVLLGLDDFVYINRGTDDGLTVGSPLEVYRPGHKTMEPARRVRVAVPDHVIANLLVVRANTEASVAVVTKFETELKLGDRFRGLSQ